MVQLGISVGLANVLLWAFIEVFVLLMITTATALMGRQSINTQLLRGKEVTINGPNDLVDILPYNGELQPVRRAFKLPLTVVRLIIVAISIYICAMLDGEPEEDATPFRVSAATSVSPAEGASLITNNGLEISSMIKLSCLKILNNNDVVMYRGYAGEGIIICEDGVDTYSEDILLEAELRSGFETPETGEDLTGMNILESAVENENLASGMNISDTAVIFSEIDESGAVEDVSTRIVLLERMNERNKCVFGMWRSNGTGFELRTDLKITTTCSLQTNAFDRLLRPKPDSIPPRMAFLHQIVDAVLVSHREENAPRRKDVKIVASLSLAAIILGSIVAFISTSLACGFAIAVRHGAVRPDLTSVGGVADVWASEKYGKDSDGTLLFQWIVADGGQGSVVCVSKEDGSEVQTRREDPESHSE